MRSIGWMMGVAAGLVACQVDVKGVEEGSTDGSDCRVDDGGHGWRCTLPSIPLPSRKGVDVLFVIDNSGSMADEQGRLAASIDALIEPLEDAGIGYRVGVTTTDNSNPWCGADTTPEAGAFVTGSCRGRLENFTFSGTMVDPPFPFDVACADHCALEPEQLDALLLPTTTDPDPEAKVRPWIEHGPLQTNLPDGVSGVDALRCVLPQGIDGCGFESQLESMYKAVQRTKNADEESFGFMRDDAVLAIVILTDEADCSYNVDWEEIFTAEGNRAFWSDPEADFPTSAVCWNAGVECTGGPGTYDECHTVDKDVDGELATNPDLAVLHPLDRYVGLVQGLQAEKKVLMPGNDVLLAVIAGVPGGYAPGNLQGLYEDTDDPVFQDDFGIGPGCMGADFSTAVPPVRLRELEEGFGEPHLYSVCADDYRPALADLAQDIESHMRAPCFFDCVRDVDPDAPGVQADCIVEEWFPGEPDHAVPPCAVEGGELVLPSPDDDACFGTITDPALMSDECRDDKWNLEFEIVQRPGTPVPLGTTLTAKCQLSEEPWKDCPGLGG